MALDGPTFMATEGWDWFLRCTTATPDCGVSLALEGVAIQRDLTVAPGDSTLRLTPAEFAALHLHHPRLWWPNGYGTPELYHLDARVTVSGQLASEKTLRFGVREVTYELSLLDSHGDLRRLEYDPTLDRDAPHGAVDVSHEGMRQVPGGYAASLGSNADDSRALRPVQMMDYVDYRAIFEGLNQHLWAPNGGRLLWMTQPAWPSMLWGILSSDYDTQASFFGSKKGCERVHVQLDYSNGEVAVVNTTRSSVPHTEVTADVLSLEGKPLFHKQSTLDAGADEVTKAFRLALGELEGNTTILVKLELHDAHGKLLSRNLYWLAATDAGYRALGAMGTAGVTATARVLPAVSADASERTVEVRLKKQRFGAESANQAHP